MDHTRCVFVEDGKHTMDRSTSSKSENVKE